MMRIMASVIGVYLLLSVPVTFLIARWLKVAGGVDAPAYRRAAMPIAHARRSEELARAVMLEEAS